MQIQQLHAFLAVAEDLSFRRAAARLHFSQAALSTQIAALEAHLGARLFQRGRFGTELTDDGRALLPLARTAVAAVAQVEHAARRRIPRVEETLTVGLLADGIGGLTWPVLRTFFKARPEVELHVVHVGFHDALPRLAAGGIDVLLGIGPFGEEDGVATTVGYVSLAAMMPRNHPRAEEATAETEWLAEHLSVRPPDAMGRTWVAYWTMQDLGARPLDRLRLLPFGTPVESMAKFVASGVIGPWPSELPALPSTAARALAVERKAPRQVLISPAAGLAAGQLAEIAQRLFEAHLRQG